MLFASEHITKASGSVGGVTYSRNRGGMYRRARAVPVNPATTNQLEVRNALTDLIQRWNDTLTPAQRTAWDLYGENTPTTNPIGETIQLSGQNWYVGNNTARLQAASKLLSVATRIDDAPTIFNRGDFTDPLFTYGVASGLIAALTTTDAWANEDGAFLFLFQGRPQNASRNFFKGPFRLVGEAAGDSTTPPTAINVPAATLATLGYAIAAGQAGWLRAVVVRADGRASSGRVYGPEIITA